MVVAETARCELCQYEYGGTEMPPDPVIWAHIDRCPGAERNSLRAGVFREAWLGTQQRAEQAEAQLAAAEARVALLERVAEAARAWSAHWHLGTCYPCLTGNDCETEMALHRTLDAALAAGEEEKR
jgi:hypothetical protein